MFLITSDESLVTLLSGEFPELQHSEYFSLTEDDSVDHCILLDVRGLTEEVISEQLIVALKIHVDVIALGESDQEFSTLCLGVSEYIRLPVSHAVLVARIDRVLKQRAQLEKLQSEAITDHLTELYNRRGLELLLQRELNHAQRNQLPVSLAMVDIDFFKAYNDRYGHQKGDQILRGVAEILRTSARRGSDLVARYGGEEFVILWSDCGKESGQMLSQRLIAAVAQAGIEHQTSPDGYLSISVGGATCARGEIGVHDLIQAADNALYRAKEGGRAQFAWSDCSV